MWKNSSSVFSFSARNWTSSTSRTSASRKRAAEGARVAAAHRLDEVGRERLHGGVAHPQPVAVGLDVVADRVEEVGLAEPRLAVDEERVVRLAGLLGDRQGGAVAEPVAVADHELVEGVARVERRGRRLVAVRDGLAPGARCPRPSADQRSSTTSTALATAAPRRGAANQRPRSAPRPSRGCGRARARRACPRPGRPRARGWSQMWKVESVTCPRSSRMTASQVADRSLVDGGWGSPGTGRRQPSGRLEKRWLFVGGRAFGRPEDPRSGQCNAMFTRLEGPIRGLPQIAGKALAGRFRGVADRLCTAGREGSGRYALALDSAPVLGCPP